MIATALPLAVPTLELPIQFIDEYIDDLVCIRTISGSDQVRPADFDLARGGVVMLVTQRLIPLQTHAHPHDVLIVAEQNGELVTHRVLHGFGKFNVHRLEDELR